MTLPGELDLPTGIDEPAFVEAVEKSGYPLQIVVGSALSERGFELEEEWAFEDPDSEIRRTLDVVARQRDPSGLIRSEQGTTELSIALLIECKQSRHPYVFFESVTPPSLDGFPAVLGLGTDLMRVFTNEGEQKVTQMPLTQVIGASRHLIVDGPPIAASLSRASVNGKKVRLSGDEPFNSLLLPLTKALERYRRQWRGERRSGYDSKSSFDLRVPLGLAVIDAPMIFVGRPSGEPNFRNVEWVRLVVRHPVRWLQRKAGGAVQRGGGFSVVDVIQRSYLNTFLDGVIHSLLEHFHAGISALNDEILLGEMQASALIDRPARRRRRRASS